MKTEILPFAGVGSLRFGNSEAEVEQALGSPAARTSVRAWSCQRLVFSKPSMDCYIDKNVGLFLVVASAAGCGAAGESDFVLRGMDPFADETVAALMRDGFEVNTERVCDSFGEGVSYRVDQLGLEFSFDTKNKKAAVFCYERKAWKDYGGAAK